MQKIAKIFKNGASQAVRLPKEFRFEGDTVLLEKEGDKVIISPAKRNWNEFIAAMKNETDPIIRPVDDLPQERDWKSFDK